MRPQENEERQECAEERCRKKRNEAEALEEELKDLWDRLVILTEEKETLEATVRDLRCRVDSQNAEIAGLREYENCFNEAFSSLNEQYSACEQKLATERKSWEKEKIDLKDQMKHLLDINADHLARLNLLTDLDIRKSPETPQRENGPSHFDIEAVEQQRPSSKHTILDDITINEHDGLVGPIHFINGKPEERMDQILCGSFCGSNIEIGQEEVDLNAPSGNMGRDIYKEGKPQRNKGKRPKLRRYRVGATRKMPGSTTQAKVISYPAQWATVDAGEAKNVSGAIETQAVIPESMEMDCHQELQTKRSTYTRLSRIHVQANRPKLISTLAVLVHRNDQRLHTPTMILVIDKSRAGCPPTEVVLHKPLADVFPSINSGVCILLKNFKVLWSHRNMPCLESHTSSEWCIGRHAGDYNFVGQLSTFGLEESAEMERLRCWWQSQQSVSGGRRLPFC